MKRFFAGQLIAKDYREFFYRSVKNMLPKNDLHDEFYKNLILCPGKEHNLHHLGLPQFDDVTTFDFNKMYGSEINTSDYEVVPDPEISEEMMNEYKKSGYKIVDDKEPDLRDYMKTKSYNIINFKSMKNYQKRLVSRKKKILKKMLMKNYTYI